MVRDLIRPEGSWVALITPFDTKGRVDMEGFKRLVDFQAHHKTGGLLLMGSTGEPTSLSHGERREIISEMAPYCRGKIPVFFGVACGSTEATIELAQFAEEKGADGIMLVVPPYIAPPQPAVYSYLKTICQSVNIAVAVYNNPARVIVNIDPPTIIKLFEECSNLVADKEAVPSVVQLASVMEGTGNRIRLLCCDAPNYALTIPTLGMGGHGTANVTGNAAPREMAELSKPWKSWEDVVRGRSLYFEYLPLMEAAYSATNPVAIKAMVKLMGLPSGDPRPPLPKIEGEKLKPLEEVIRRFKLKEKYGLIVTP
ncbi:MAG: 4-hydroxy-tetrahydrodipicolinate synthase [Deltaproteobacteria bacterium RBG_16_49_23]|nr:MAG: 4-hydroxy-tetrahydrodipicolinate synthase [Deltaproteobacteria bacterium RBG_16_49_23]